MNICQCLTTTAKLFPDKVAIVFDEQHWSYAQLETKSQAAAHWLSQQGVQAGDRIAIMLPNALSFPVWYYATLRIGAIAVSVSTRLAASEVAFVVEDCGASRVCGIRVSNEVGRSGTAGSCYGAFSR